MDNFITIATNKNRFRSACKDLSLARMEKMVANLSEFIEKKRQTEEENKAIESRQLAKKQEILQAMKAAGLSADDFI